MNAIELMPKDTREYLFKELAKLGTAKDPAIELQYAPAILNQVINGENEQVFKSGLYKISKSMYGYCTKGNLCDKKEAIDPTFCGASCNTMVITKQNADNWQKLYFRNHKLLNSGVELSIGGIPMNAAKTTMQSQNEVAKKIMEQFNMKYED